MTTPPIRVMVVDDHAVVRAGLATFLAAYDDLQHVGSAANGEEAVARCAHDQPDVILMDLVMPRMDGVAAIRAIRATCPNARVVVLTSFGDDQRVQNALAAGASGYLMKDATAAELAGAIRAAAAGRVTLAPEATEALVHALKSPPPGRDLTAREREVLRLMVAGQSNPEIAAALSISRSTVKFHVSAILGKLGVDSRTEAVALAVEHHLADEA